MEQKDFQDPKKPKQRRVEQTSQPDTEQLDEAELKTIYQEDVSSNPGLDPRLHEGHEKGRESKKSDAKSDELPLPEAPEQPSLPPEPTFTILEPATKEAPQKSVPMRLITLPQYESKLLPGMLIPTSGIYMNFGNRNDDPGMIVTPKKRFQGTTKATPSIKKPQLEPPPAEKSMEQHKVTSPIRKSATDATEKDTVLPGKESDKSFKKTMAIEPISRPRTVQPSAYSETMADPGVTEMPSTSLGKIPEFTIKAPKEHTFQNVKIHPKQPKPVENEIKLPQRPAQKPLLLVTLPSVSSKLQPSVLLPTPGAYAYFDDEMPNTNPENPKQQGKTAPQERKKSPIAKSSIQKQGSKPLPLPDPDKSNKQDYLSPNQKKQAGTQPKGKEAKGNVEVELKTPVAGSPSKIPIERLNPQNQKPEPVLASAATQAVQIPKPNEGQLAKVQDVKKAEGQLPKVQDVKKPEGQLPKVQDVKKAEGQLPKVQDVKKPEGQLPKVQDVKRSEGQLPKVQDVKKAEGLLSKVQDVQKASNAETSTVDHGHGHPIPTEETTLVPRNFPKPIYKEHLTFFPDVVSKLLPKKYIPTPGAYLDFLPDQESDTVIPVKPAPVLLKPSEVPNVIPKAKYNPPPEIKELPPKEVVPIPKRPSPQQEEKARQIFSKLFGYNFPEEPKRDELKELKDFGIPDQERSLLLLLEDDAMPYDFGGLMRQYYSYILRSYCLVNMHERYRGASRYSKCFTTLDVSQIGSKEEEHDKTIERKMAKLQNDMKSLEDVAVDEEHFLYLKNLAHTQPVTLPLTVLHGICEEMVPVLEDVYRFYAQNLGMEHICTIKAGVHYFKMRQRVKMYTQINGGSSYIDIVE